MRAFSVLLALSAPLLSLAAPAGKRAAGASANDVLALQFANVLEQLETQFYKQALSQFQPSDFTTAGFNNPQLVVDQLLIISQDEATHTSIIQSTLEILGVSPLTTCVFDFTSVLTDVKTTVNVARLVENVGVSAYLGAAALLIDNIQILTAAASILTVEARHQTIHNLLAGGTSIYSSFDMALAPSQVLAIAGAFISGCDLGVPANPALTVTNTGPVGVGSQLTFSSPALNNTNTSGNLTCQMMVGGAVASIPQPIDNCVVPNGIDGLVYIYITNTNQPLLSDLTVQFSADIVAGPTGVFIDTQEDLLAELISSSAIGGNPAFASGGGDNLGDNGNSTEPPSFPPTSTSTTSFQSSLPSSTAALGGTSTFLATSTMNAAAASSLLASLSSASLGGTSAAPSATSTGVPSNVGGNPGNDVNTGPNLETGDIGGANVVGWSSTSFALPTATSGTSRKKRSAAVRYYA